MTIAVVDDGIDTDSPEFSGRLSPLSADVAGNGTVESESDHGTHVALFAAAARDNTGIMGIAYNATILAVRADDPGSCAAGDCSFFDDDIAAAVDYAVANGARIINISLGGGAPNFRMRNAIADAAAAGVMVVVSAGNDGAISPDAFATGLRQAGGENVIIAGSVYESGAISDFSDRAGVGSNASYYLAARGEALCCEYVDGALYEDNEGFIYLLSGTSFAAPQIAGAAALLAQAFPNLSGQQIVDLLLNTAQDAGSSGVDSIYGAGILDIAAAFQPQGQTSLAGGTSALPLGDTVLTGSPAMGDAAGQGSMGAVILDGYDRAFAVNLSRSLRSAAAVRRLDRAIASRTETLGAAGARASVAVTIDARGRSYTSPWQGDSRLTMNEAEQARVIAARVALNLAPAMQLGFAFSEGADGLVAQLQGHASPAFMIAPDASSGEGFNRTTEMALAYRHTLGDWGITIGAESGRMTADDGLDPQDDPDRIRNRDRVRTFSLALDRRIGAFSTSLAANWMHEDRSILGAHLHDGLGSSGAQSLFIDARASWDFAPRWSLGGTIRNGWTYANTAETLAAGSNFVSRAWSFDIATHGTFQRNDQLALRIAQPLRVENGGLNFALPVAYDYASGAVTTGIQRMNLSPSGREVIAELAWRGSAFSGEAGASLFYRKDPGHVAGATPDKGLAIRWSRDF